MFICQFCKSDQVKEVLYLGSLPPVNDMPKIDSSVKATNTFPVSLCFCSICTLTQIGITLDKEIVFPHSYPYLSGVTKSLVNNFKDQAIKVNELINLNQKDLVVDIGSNDGSLLKHYRNHCRILGIEPTKAAESAIEEGIDTINQYFTSSVVEEIISNHGKAKVVTACNVFAHISGLDELMFNISELLLEDGIFVSESHYLLSLVESLQFDTIYHEHLRYYSLTFLEKLFEKYGFKIFNVEKIDSHGGSIRVWSSRSLSYGKKSSVKEMIGEEQKHGIVKIIGLEHFSSKVIAWRQEFRRVITELKLDGARISGVGAPSRASTLIAFAGLTELDLDAVAEVEGSAKIGHYMPGTRIPVEIESEVLSKEPTHLLILSWHLKDSIMSNLRSKGFKGKFIIPLPNPHVD